MASDLIGALRVVLGADAAALIKGVADAQSSLEGFASAAKKIAGVVGVSLTFGAATAAIKGTISSFDALSKSSQKIGVPIEELSALKLAAQLSDVSMESMQKGVGKLSKALVATAQGSTKSAQGFTTLGIGVRNADGSIKSISDILPEIANKFASMPDGPVKTALAMQLLGKSGADLIPLLNGGAAALKEATDEAKLFGLVVSQNTGKQAEQFNDNLTRLSGAITGVLYQAVASILPALANFSQFLVDGVKNSTFLKEAANALSAGFAVIARAAIVVYDNIGLIVKIGAVFVGAQIGAAVISMGIAFVKAAAAIRATSLIMGAFELIRGISMRGILLMAGIVALATGAFDGFGEKIGKIGNFIATLLPEGAGEKVTGIMSALGLNLEGLTKDLTTWQGVAGKDGGGLFNPAVVNTAKNAIDQFLVSQQKAIAGQVAEAQTVGKSTGEQAKLRIELEAKAIATAKNIPLTDALNARIAATGDAAALAAMKLQAAQLVQETMNPAEKYAQQMAQIKLLYDTQLISLDTLGRKQKEISEQAGTAWNIAGASIAGSFSSIAASFGKEGSKMAKVAQIFGIIQGTISMYTGAAKALELPFPANLAAMATVLAKGASMIASIKAQQIPTGFMTGGSFTVRGSGGADSTPVQFMATPGEQIDVWRPDQGGGADPRGRARGRAQAVNLSVPIATTRDALRSLIEGLNDMFSDGYRLNVVPV